LIALTVIGSSQICLW